MPILSRFGSPGAILKGPNAPRALSLRSPYMRGSVERMPWTAARLPRDRRTGAFFDVSHVQRVQAAHVVVNRRVCFDAVDREKSARILAKGDAVSGTYTTPTSTTGPYALDLLAPTVGWLVGNAGTTSGITTTFSFGLDQTITLTGGTTYVFALSHS